MRILPLRLLEELRAEQRVRGEREGDSFYAGEIIGPLVPERQTASMSSSTVGTPRPDGNLCTKRCRQQGTRNGRIFGTSAFREGMDGRTTKQGQPELDRADGPKEKKCFERSRTSPGSGHSSSLPMAWPYQSSICRMICRPEG